MFSLRLLILTLCFVSFATAQAEEPVIVSIQPATYWSLPVYIAQEEGYFDAFNLTVTRVVYPSGAPQVQDAIDNAAWDMGAAGVVPNIIGGLQGILNIGVSNDESFVNQLVANAQGAAAWPPESIENVTFAFPPNSTGQFAVRACLAAKGFAIQDIDALYLEQPDVLHALAPVNGSEPLANYGGLWAPNVYTFLAETPGAASLCSGATVFATITGGIMVRPEFANEKPDVVNKVLASWLRAIEFINDDRNRDAVLAYMTDFYSSFDVSISRNAMEQEIDQRPLFGLTEQLELNKGFGDSPSIYQYWTSFVSQFLFDAGTIDRVPDPTTFVTDEFLTNINEDENLRAFALGQEPPAPMNETSEAIRSDRCLLGTLFAVICAAGLIIL